MDTKKTTWWRFRVKDRASGPSEWDYCRAGDEEWAREKAEHAHRYHMDSKGFRGFDIERIPAPPMEWLLAEAERLKKHREGLDAEMELVASEVRRLKMGVVRSAAALLAASLHTFPWFISAGAGYHNGDTTVFVYVDSDCDREEVNARTACGCPVFIVPTRHPAPATTR
jgi:hypothetical protein